MLDLAPLDLTPNGNSHLLPDNLSCEFFLIIKENGYKVNPTAHVFHGDHYPLHTIYLPGSTIQFLS